MKKILTLTGSCLLLLLSVQITAQQTSAKMKLFKKPMGSSAATVQRVHPSTANSSNTCVVDSIVLTSQAEIDNFSTNYPACTTPRYLIIDGAGASPAITNLDGLLQLGEVTNVLEIRNTAITNTNGLNNLWIIGDSLRFINNSQLAQIALFNVHELGAVYFHNLPALTSISGLSNNIDTLNGEINIDSTAITDVADGFGHLVWIKGGLNIAHSDITSVGGFSNLTHIEGYLFLEGDTLLTHMGITTLTGGYGFLIANCPLLTDITGLSNNFTNGNIGTFWFINTGLTNLHGMEGITGCPNFYLWSNPNLTSIAALSNLSGNIGYGISMWNNNQLTDLSPLSGITEVSNNTVEIAYLPITSLHGLHNITHIGKGLWLYGNDNLTTLDSLNASLVIDNGDPDNNGHRDSLRIFDNTQLSVCRVAPICNYLNIDGRAEIYNNAPGCGDLAEVIASCGNPCPLIDSVTWNGSNSSDWDDSSNWTPSIVPATCTHVTIPPYWSTNNSPLTNSDVSIAGLVMEDDAELYLNGFNLTINGAALNMQNARIYNGNNIVARHAYQPDIEGCEINGNFSSFDYGGESKFFFNTVYGNTVLSDSIGRSEGTSAIINNFYGDLHWINNSDYGQSYLSNASPGHDYIDGNLTVINASSADISVGLGGGSPLEVRGNFIVNSDNGNIDINTIKFVGNGNSHITQGGTVPIVINTLGLAKYGGGDVILDQGIKVISDLNFDPYGGNLHTASDRLLTLENWCFVSYSTFGANGILGPVKKIGNQAITFPLANIENNTYWFAPLTMSAPADPADAFTVEYFHHNPGLDGYDTAVHSPGFAGVSAKEYWKLTRDSGNSKVKVVLYYDSLRSGSSYLYQDMQVANWNPNLWKSLSSGGYIGQVYGGTLASADSTTGGPLTFSFKSVRKPIITIGNVDTFHCTVTSFYVPFTLDTLMIAGNQFRAELSDTLGNFDPYTTQFIGGKTSISSDSIAAFVADYLVIPGKAYKIRVVGSIPRDTSVNTKTVIFKRRPIIGFSIEGSNSGINNNFCLGNGPGKYYPSIHEPGASYRWFIQNVGAGTGATITTDGDTAYVTSTTTGSFYLFAQAFNDCGNGTYNSQLVNVMPPPPTATPVINNTGRWLYSSAKPANTSYNWYRNGTLISGATTSSYYASLAGDYTVKFSNYCGTSPVSNTISFGANALSQTITFPSMPDKTYGDPPFVPAASATSGLPVSFTIVSGPASINSQTNILTITGTGLVTVKANQSGDNAYDTAAPVTRSFNVFKSNQTITFAAIANQDYNNPPFALSATTSSLLPVTYTIVSGPATVSGNTVTITGVGTVTVRALQGGDTNYFAATPVDRSFCVSVANLTTISGYNNLCPGTATYSINNVPGATYFWRIVGGATLSSATNTANVTWTTPGTYQLLVSASGSCGSASANDTLVVNVINSIQPDSVHSMLPEDGAINQQLPLTLSWVPAQPAGFYTFDVYVWPSNQSQPVTPYAANLTSVNYTIPLNSGLAYNLTYKWMVVAHNGSCTQINTGPIQQFSLIPLPDLVVSNVQAPATAFSGQTININWTVSNPGPGITTTNQSWTDAVFLSFDTTPVFSISPQTNPAAWSLLSFPVKPLLIGTRPNVSALSVGQQYTNSMSFTLPVNYSQPAYVYVITNYPAGANAPVQVTVANDTARAPQPIAITLSPTPDLRVDTVFTPSTTFSGSTINVTYKVKNYGVLTPSGTGWTDKVYISQSPLFNINTAIPLKFPKANGTYYANAQEVAVGNSAQLLADSSYTKSIEVVVPNYIFGSYFIYVVTNSGGNLYEGPLANNNINRSALQVFLTPTPHLTVNSLTVPVTAASTTQPISVNWNIFNAGFNDNIEKNKGHYFVKSGDCLIPPPPCPDNLPPGTTCNPGPPTAGISFRDSLSFGSSYWLDRVYLSTDGSGLNTNAAILVNETTQGVLNSGLFIDDNYTNPNAMGCKQLGTNPSLYNLNVSNVIKAGSNHPKTGNFNIPDNIPEGNYYIYVITNPTKTVYEYPGTTETRRSALPITVQRPDATVPSVTAPSTAVGGTPITISYTVLNNGGGAVFNHFRRDNVYVSSSPTFDGSAQLVATPNYSEDLPVGTAVQHSINYTFPVSTSGTRYIYVHTNFDSSFRENNQNNNMSSPVVIAVSPATPNDLVVSSIQLADTVYAISPTYFKYTVPNNGAGVTAGTWVDSVFISCSPSFNPSSAYYVTSRSHSETVGSGGSYSDSFNVNIPYSFTLNSCFPQTSSPVTAYFFVKTNANNIVYEGSNGNNNTTGTGSRILINPLVDQIVTQVTGADTATVGRPYTTGWSVKNIGYNPGYNYYNSWADMVFFSPDSTFNANAVQANYYYEYSVLNTNQSYTESKNVTTPNVPTGDYYVFVRTNQYNQILGEINNNNHNLLRDGSGAAKKIHVVKPLLPDLTDSIVSATTLVAIGQPLTTVYRISNSGVGVTYPDTWSNAVWLSSDFTPGNAGDRLLSGKNHTGALMPGQSFNDTVSAIIPLNTIPGNYILISQANSTGNVFESNSANNLSFKYITVYSPAPVDLLVENIMKPDTVFLGYTLDTAKWVIRNNAPNTATGISSDGIYLSAGTVLDSSAILLGIKNKNIAMPPLAKDTVSLAALVNNVTEGLYNVIVKTDLLNNIVETDKSNNTGVALTQVYVKVKELPMNVLTPNTLGTINRFYKLIIPDSLNGATVLVTLKSGDSLTMKNQMFIGKGYIPSAANFDYTYSTPNYGNQQIIITSVTTGVYYISIRCVSANSVVQNITLKAEKLPFKILSVQSTSGGNTGNVTIKINGSLFVNNMIAQLSKPGTSITASAIYFTNSTTVYATFNLQGRPLGIYDVILTKPDTSMATLAGGFSVVNANNGGLITGGGINTGAGNGNAPGCAPGAASGLNSQLVTEMVMPDKVFAGWPFTIQINYNNPTNIDVPAQIRILYSERDIRMALNPADVANGSTALYLELTEQGGPPGIIRAGGSGSITVYAKAPLTVPAHTHVFFSLK